MRVEQKLEAAARAGYVVILWATSIHARTHTVTEQARELGALGLLPGVRSVITLFVDFWSPDDPYTNRPRCHKKMQSVARFKEREG